jgi:16S rRNA (guanine966-N2)-methyltransferase
MSIRVISGQAKGRKLKMVPGDTTRPITDRVKENLFNIVGDDVRGSRWLDLFAGTGQVGIEALSRGAAEVVFIDTARQAIRIINDNLRHTGLSEGGAVLRQDAFAYLRQTAGRRHCDVIYVAPPQYKTIWRDVLLLLDQEPAAHLRPNGQVIVQIDPREYQELPLQQLELRDQRRYGSTMLCFYSRPESSSAPDTPPAT